MHQGEKEMQKGGKERRLTTTGVRKNLNYWKLSWLEKRENVIVYLFSFLPFINSFLHQPNLMIVFQFFLEEGSFLLYPFFLLAAILSKIKVPKNESFNLFLFSSTFPWNCCVLLLLFPGPFHHQITCEMFHMFSLAAHWVTFLHFVNMRKKGAKGRKVQTAQSEENKNEHCWEKGKKGLTATLSEDSRYFKVRSLFSCPISAPFCSFSLILSYKWSWKYIYELLHRLH